MNYIYSIVFFWSTMLCAQTQPVTQTADSLPAKLEQISWLSGQWKGEAFGGQTEENWSVASAGSMMAVFKLITNNQVSFYDLKIIREVEQTLVLQIKHFDPDLKGWETKNETVDCPLLKLTPTQAVFEGMRFEKISDTKMRVYVDVENDEGQLELIQFNYKKHLE